MRKRIFEIIDIEDEERKKNSYYDEFMTVCIILSLVPLCFKETNLAFVWIERVTTGIFVLDYILRWGTADLKFPGNKVWAYIRYPFTPFAVVDLLSILPSLSVLGPGFKMFRLFRLGKAFRALRLLRYSKSFELIARAVKREREALGAVCVLAGGYILLSALIVFQVEPNSFDSFFDAVYWAVVTLTTVGYGDLYPVSDIGRVVGMISSFVGIAIVALPTGIITAGYMHELSKARVENEND
nr:ion transporter [Eubacterium sp.]